MIMSQHVKTGGGVCINNKYLLLLLLICFSRHLCFTKKTAGKINVTIEN